MGVCVCGVPGDWTAPRPVSSKTGGVPELRSQVRQIAVQVERLRVGEGLAILDRQPVHHRPHRELADLPADGARNVGDLYDLVWHMAGAGVVAQGAPDALAQGGVQGE